MTLIMISAKVIAYSDTFAVERFPNFDGTASTLA